MIIQIQQDEDGKTDSITFIAEGENPALLKQKAKQWLKTKYSTLTLDDFMGKIRSMDDHQIRMDAPGG
jgi:hypothetical protein